jgi:aryl-alcohol dehydrogenase-like predicted oxidoreductase
VPEKQRKLEAVEQLAQVADDAGLSLIELAIAFIVNHPCVESLHDTSAVPSDPTCRSRCRVVSRAIDAS